MYPNVMYPGVIQPPYSNTLTGYPAAHTSNTVGGKIRKSKKRKSKKRKSRKSVY